MERRKVLLSSGTLLTTAIAGCIGENDSEETPANNNVKSEDKNDESGDITNEDDSETPTGAPEIAIGEVVSDGDFSLVIRDIERDDITYNYDEPDEGNEFLFVDVAMKNEMVDKYGTINGSFEPSITDNDDYSYDPTYLGLTSSLNHGQIAPGEVERGNMVFEVPKSSEEKELRIDLEGYGLFSFDRIWVNLDEENEQIEDLNQNLHANILDIGETIEQGGVEVTLHSMETTYDEVDKMYLDEADPGHEYVILNIETTNESGEEHEFLSSRRFHLKYGNGETNLGYAGSRGIEQPYGGSPLPDGVTQRGNILYEVEENLSPLYWAFDFSLWTEDGKRTFWQLR